MKIFIMSDLEGVAGVMNGDDYLSSNGRYYDVAKRLLTEEVNAGIAGLAEHGFDEFVVADGHGKGGINIELLDPRAKLQRGWGSNPYPFGMDKTFDACAYIGQHAKAGTPYSHITHTGWWDVLDLTVNGVSIGEYGQGALCAGELGIPMIFAAGEQAFCEEVFALTPWVTTAAVLQGTLPGTGNDLTGEQYANANIGAIHLQPKAACQLIHQQAALAAKRFQTHRDSFKLLKFNPPYQLTQKFRPYSTRNAYTAQGEHATSVIALFNGPTTPVTPTTSI